MTPSRAYQLRNRAAGLCEQCPNPAENGSRRCDPCAEADRDRHRAAAGSKPWRPGGTGRPPLSAGKKVQS